MCCQNWLNLIHLQKKFIHLLQILHPLSETGHLIKKNYITSYEMKECKFSLKVRKYITLLASLLLVFFTSELLSQAVLYKLIDGKKIKSDQNVLASDKTFNKDTYVINNINPSQDDDRLLIFESAQVDKLYLFINGNLADTLKYGNIVPSAARRFRDRNIILPLKWMKNDQDIIIKVTKRNIGSSYLSRNGLIELHESRVLKFCRVCSIISEEGD